MTLRIVAPAVWGLGCTRPQGGSYLDNLGVKLLYFNNQAHPSNFLLPEVLLADYPETGACSTKSRRTYVQ